MYNVKSSYGLRPLEINYTEKTPYIKLDKEHSTFLFEGNSYPDDIHACYAPVLHWVDRYLESPNAKTVLDFNLVYINSSSSQMLFLLIKKFESIYSAENEVLVRWHYHIDDEDMYEEGLGYAEKIQVPFEFVQYDD